MELLQQILEGLWAGFWALVDFLEPIIASLVEMMFDVEIPPGGARGFTVVLLVLVGAWAISIALSNVTKSPAIAPMTVTHHTTKTPAQVVLEDLGAKLRAVLIIGVVVVVLYYVGTVAVP
jgi:hypothetical protein